MNLRDACLEDIQQLIEIGKEFHKESVYKIIPFHEEKTRSFLESAVNGAYEKNSFFKVIVDNEIIYGGLIGYISEYYFSNAYCANDLAFFIRSEKRGTIAGARLIKEFVQWGQERGVTEVCIGVSSGINAIKVGKFLEVMKFNCVGGIYKYSIK